MVSDDAHPRTFPPAMRCKLTAELGIHDIIEFDDHIRNLDDHIRDLRRDYREPGVSRVFGEFGQIN